MTPSDFDSAGFLNHHWFQNALVPFWQKRTLGKYPPYTLGNLSADKTLERVAECHSSGKLSKALQDIPDDILLFLSRYIFPAEELVRNMGEEDFYEYYKDVDTKLSALMEKYGAH